MPTLASSSSVQIAYVAETTFGTTPVVGNGNKLRVTGESLDFAISKESSKEINDTRTISSMIATSANASGGVQGEVSFHEYDALIAATLQSTWTAFGTAGVSATATVTFAATTLTASVATSGSSDWSTLAKGQFFRVAAAADANDGKILRVSTTVAPTDTVITLDASTPAAVSAAVAGVTIQTSRLTHGSTQTSFSIERGSPDINQYITYVGMTPSKLNVGISSAALSTISFDFMGKSANRTTVTAMPGTVVASHTHEVHSGVAGSACLLWEAGVPLTGTYVKSLSLAFDNALRSQEAICSLGAVGIGAGTINIGVTMSVYFADGSLFDKFKANTNSSITFSTLDSSGNGYVFTVPVANVTSWKTTAGGKDSDMMVDVQLTGLRDATNATAALQKAIFIDRVGVATSS